MAPPFDLSGTLTAGTGLLGPRFLTGPLVLKITKADGNSGAWSGQGFQSVCFPSGPTSELRLLTQHVSPEHSTAVWVPPGPL